MSEKILVDSTGKALTSNGTKIRQYFRKNGWKTLEGIVSFGVILINIVGIIASIGYAKSCSRFYNVPERYFDGMLMFRENSTFFIVSMLFLLYPVIFIFANEKIKSKIFAIISFVITAGILFMQNIVYTVSLLDEIRWECLRRIIDNYVMIIIFLLADIVIAFYLILRKRLFKEKVLKIFEKKILMAALVIWTIDVSIGFSLTLGSDVSDIKNYEVIDGNKVIVSVYDGKFLTMDCKIDGKKLIIIKGKYSFIEMENNNIIYNEYDEIICK